MSEKIDHKVDREMASNLCKLAISIKHLVEKKDSYASLLFLFINLFLESLEDENKFHLLSKAIIIVENSTKEDNK